MQVFVRIQGFLFPILECSMFKEVVRSCNIFKEEGLEDSLFETMRLFDLVSGGCLSKIDPSQLEALDLDLQKIAELRKQGVPMEYIVGKAIFMDLMLHCTPDTLIPRGDTVLLVETALDLIEEKQEDDPGLVLIELGTGCGNIAVAIAMNAPGVKILASDIDPAAIKIARKNVDKYELKERISLSCGDLLDSFSSEVLEGKIDLIVCNPPYIPTSSLQKLDPDIINHEPILALDAGTYGIDIFRRLIKDAVPFLKEGGALLFEIGARQEKIVTRLLQKNGNYVDIGHYDDGNDVRVISASKKSR